MATTSLWHIEGRLKDLIDYVENPEKTTAKTPKLQDLYNVFSYVQRPEATQKGEYVTALNCLKETALRQMILTKKRYGKTDGYIAWHGYQSFRPEEVTPQLAHEIGVKLAKEMWGDRFEIIVTTHLDKEHIHCHFCFNSVSFRDGGKYNYSKAERKRMMEISDRLCREYGLSVMHELNPPIVCCDVKPSSIMIHNGLDVSMFDFGIAMRYYDDGREDEHIVGTVGYAALEQYEGHARLETDIYGLGMTLYYMLTKDNPKTPGFTHRSIREYNSKATPELEHIIERCIEPDYKNRYRSCDALICDLDHFINGSTSAWLSKLFRKK